MWADEQTEGISNMSHHRKESSRANGYTEKPVGIASENNAHHLTRAIPLRYASPKFVPQTSHSPIPLYEIPNPAFKKAKYIIL
jgi:hypothetical protein